MSGEHLSELVAGRPGEPDSEQGVLSDFDAASPVLAVAFGGMMLRLDGIPPFEFFRILGDAVPVKKLFVRDHRQAYYHRGVRGFGDDIAGIETAIGDVIAQTEASKVVMVGSSGGGYAALLFGRLLGVAEVHAFAPTTFLRADLRDRYDDHRFENRWAALMRSGRYQARYGDLRKLFRQTPDRGTRFVIHYCSGYAIDVAHADWLAAEPEVELRPYDVGEHSLVKHLRDSGELAELLRGAMAG